ncbi:MAG: hypothetical protein C4334_00985 [Pyrinomonas sp.]|uniref:hypothetical protein n=1 Tax=Pyrinomonas sp. TaxID=2080306 RepID=UPI00332D19ED
MSSKDRDRIAQWKEEERRAQAERYKRIVADMEALAPERDRWVEEFFERIQTRGWSFHAGMRRRIPRDQIPKRPDRPWRVVW